MSGRAPWHRFLVSLPIVCCSESASRPPGTSSELVCRSEQIAARRKSASALREDRTSSSRPRKEAYTVAATSRYPYALSEPVGMRILESDAHLDVDLREFLRILRRRKRVLIYTVAVLVAFVVGLSLAQTPVYSAATTVLIPSDVRRSVDQNRQAFSSPDLLNRALTNEIAFAQGDQVRAAVRKRLGLIPSVKITPVADTDTLSFAAEGTDPKRAAREANEYAQAYLQERRAARTADYLNTAETLVDEIRSLRNRPNQPESGRPAESGDQGVDRKPAAVSGRPSSQRAAVEGRRKHRSNGRPSRRRQSRPTLRETASWRDCSAWCSASCSRSRGIVLTTRSLRRTSCRRHAGGTTVMGLIPLSAEPNPSKEQVVSISRPSSFSAEAYRILRASIQIRDQLEGGGLRVLAVTSPGASEGKTSTVANLGVALARTGQRVVILDYDLRRPRIDKVFGCQQQSRNHPGAPGGERSCQCSQEVRGQPGLSVVAAGQVPPNPSEILRSVVLTSSCRSCGRRPTSF